MPTINNLPLFALVLLLCCLFTPTLSKAQSPKEFANELEEANLSVYQDPEKAISLSTYVYENATHLDTKIYALVTMVNGYTALNKNGKALKYATKTLELAESSENAQYQIWALGLLGEQYQLCHLNGISREYLDKAEVLIQNSNLSAEAMAVSSGNIFAIKGNGYKDEIDCEYAIKNYDLSIASYRSISENSVTRNNLALVFLEKGNCLLELNDLEQAEADFRKTLAIANQNELEEYKHKASMGIAKIATRQGNYQAAKESAVQILSVIDTTQNSKLKTDLYYLLKENFLALGSEEKYRFYDQKYKNAVKEIEKMESNQLEEVLQFIEENSIETENHLTVVDYLLYLFSTILLAITGWEFFKWARRTRISNKK